MESFYLVIVCFLLLLAVMDLFVGVSNDAVNFLTNAVGAKVSSLRTIFIIAALGIFFGALMSSGMMDVARHGVMNPQYFSFHEVIVIFLAVMLTDVIILDIFNSLGLPTSTTISLVFELLGATFIMSMLKMNVDPSLTLADMMNSDKALQMIIAIFVSVAFAFVCGVIVQWISRLIFSFNYKKNLKYTMAIFGGVALTFLCYFIFVKGISSSPFIEAETKDWINSHTTLLIGMIFAGATILCEVLNLFKVNVFKIIVLLGTFALAMAFAGNDLVNFIGVPLAALSSYEDYSVNGGGDSLGFMMESLQGSAQSPFLYLLLAGVIMIIAMTTSKKAKNVIRTSVDLSRQDEADEMFGSSRVARSIVRTSENISEFVTNLIPLGTRQAIGRRFNKNDIELEEGAAFDVVRGSVNLVISAALIIIGTLYKLPLSTTYVTFMVAMGSSLADKAWSKDSAVFRVTGVISVIGGWFITAGAAFLTCAIVASVIYFGGVTAMVVLILLAVFLIVRSNIRFAKKMKEETGDSLFAVMMRTKDPNVVQEMLNNHLSTSQTKATNFVMTEYNNIINGLENDDLSLLRQTKKRLDHEKVELKKNRRREYLALKRTPRNFAIEKNTWFHLCENSNSQALYCLRRMLEPALEHVENSFKDMPENYVENYKKVSIIVNDLLRESEKMISTGNYTGYLQCLNSAQECKSLLSTLRDNHLDRMHDMSVSEDYNVSLLYLNLLQETQELLSIVRHQLRAINKFTENPQSAQETVYNNDDE